ncbi:hypothetical protein [Streptomyces sp. NBC_00286]|nr:hypothetical protein [Streptomyces sp. NBC_00286]
MTIVRLSEWIGGTGQYRSAYGDGTITLDGRYVYLDLLVEE